MSFPGSAHGADTLASIIHSTLAQCDCTLHRPAPSAWRAAGPSGEPFAVTVEDGWLTIDRVASGDVAAQPPLTVLANAASLPANTKLIAMGPNDRIHLRAELSLDVDLDLDTHIPAVIAAFAATNPVTAETSLSSDEPTAPQEANHGSSLADRCAEVGWPAVERPDGALAVELEVPGSFVQAMVRRQENGEWWIEVPVAPGDPAPDVCREATARLLLRVGGLVRLVQAVLLAEGGAASAGFRVRVLPAASSAAFGHAFAALSVACRLCAREAAVLWHDERVARVYIERALPERTAK